MSSIARSVTLASFAWSVAAFAACGSEADSAPGSGGTTSGGGTGAIGAIGGTGGVTIDTGLEDVVDPDSGCGTVTEKAIATPLHLYVMLDKSDSMAGGTGYKWSAAKTGLIAFVKDSSSNGIYVGLKFFPRDADGTELCSHLPYMVPDTPFAVLPGNATAIETALANEVPNGLSTPVWPALGGAIVKGIEIAKNNPGHSAAVLLVTDGVPQGPAPTCSGVDPTSATEIAKLAATGLANSPPVYTYVIGLPGVDQTFANEVAKAGGSGSAILVSNTNVEKEFQDALAKVRGQALPCEFTLPDQVTNGTYDTGKVNVQLTPGGGSPTSVLQTPDCNQADGWYYDPGKTKIILCPKVCDSLKKDYQAKVQIVLGCPTEVVK